MPLFTVRMQTASHLMLATMTTAATAAVDTET